MKMTQRQTVKQIVYIDDSKDEFFLSRMMFKAEKVDIDLVCFPDVDPFFEDFDEKPVTSLEDTIVVLDLNLTVIKGTEGVAQIRDRTYGREAIIGICTGSDDPADKKLAEDAGADFFVMKPLDRSSLLQICDAVPNLSYLVNEDGTTIIERQ